MPVSAASHGEDDGPNVPGSSEKSAHRHYERSPRWMAQGRGVGPAAKAEGKARPGTGKLRRAPRRHPVPEARNSGSKRRRGGRSDGRRH